MLNRLIGSILFFVILQSGILYAADNPAQYLESGKIISQNLGGGRFGIGFEAGPVYIKSWSFMGDEQIKGTGVGGAGFLEFAYGVQAHIRPYLGFFIQGQGMDYSVAGYKDSADQYIERYADLKNPQDSAKVEEFKGYCRIRNAEVKNLQFGINLLMMSERSSHTKLRFFGGGGGGATFRLRSEEYSQLAFMWDLSTGAAYQIGDRMDLILELRHNYILKDKITNYSSGLSVFMLAAGIVF